METNAARLLFHGQTLTEDGVSKERLKQVHSSIGLDIGSETPEEISVNIYAELIRASALSNPVGKNDLTIVKNTIAFRLFHVDLNFAEISKNHATEKLSSVFSKRPI